VSARAAAAVPSPALAVRQAASLADGAARPPRSAKQVAQIGAAIGGNSPIRCWPGGGQAGPDLGSALDRLINAGLLFSQARAHATYLFKHAWCRTRLMARCCANPDGRPRRIAEVLQSQFSELPSVSRSCWRAIALRLA